METVPLTAATAFETGSRYLDECRTDDTSSLRLTQLDAFTWTARISQQVKCGQARKALRIYEEMKGCGVQCSSYTYVAALKACSGLKDLEAARKIHAEVVAMGFESVVNVGNSLVAVYAKSGSLVDARRIFNRMPYRNVVSWTAMISGYAQMQEGEQALRLYMQMREEGVVPNDRTFVAVLKACSSLAAFDDGDSATGALLKQQCLEYVRAIHYDVVTSGAESTMYVETMLVDAYAKCGSLDAARRIFENMPHRDVVAWNAIILGCAQLEQGAQALQLYSRMQQEGMLPNDRTFVGALKACTSLAGFVEETEADVRKLCLEQVRALHFDLVRSGCDSAVYVGNMLLAVYAKCGSLVEARSIFEKMPDHSVVSWNSMILGYAQMEMGEEALQLYAQMQEEGVVPDARTFVAALKACSSLASVKVEDEYNRKLVNEQCLEQVRCVHLSIAKMKLEADIFVGTTLVDVYAKCGSLVDARRVFEHMPHRTVVSWNALILGYAQMNKGQEALLLYTRMQEEGFVPDDGTFAAALNACCNLAGDEDCDSGGCADVTRHCLKQVRRLHLDILHWNLQAHKHVGAMLVDAYLKCGSILDARSVFDDMPHHILVCWNTMISGYAHMEQGEEALRLFTRMQQEGASPDDRTFVAALKACGHAAALEKGIEIHSQVRKSGLEEASGLFVPTALIYMYAKCGSMDNARQVFDGLSTRDVVAWNALILGYAHQGESAHAFELFHRMIEDGIEPDSVAFLSVLTACSHAGLVDKGKMYFEAMSKRHGITPNIDHYNCIVGLLGRAGQLANAMAVINTMPLQPDLPLWQTLLTSCRITERLEDSDLKVQGA